MFFNGITEAFFHVPNERAAAYETIINNPDAHSETFSSFVDKMKVQGFVVDDEVDELELVKRKFESLIRRGNTT